MSDATIYELRDAVESDSQFLGAAITEAERAHTGTGVWDVLCSNTNTSSVMEYACKNDTASHVHYSRFLVYEEVTSGALAAAACAFIYPNCSVSKSKPGLIRALTEINNVSENDATATWDEKLSFLDESFPDYDYDDSWMLEAVYTSPDHRGKGLAYKLLSKLIENGRKSGCKKSLITCAVGNDAAKKLYEKLGYVLVGTGHSEACQEALGSSGFHLLCLQL